MLTTPPAEIELSIEEIKALIDSQIHELSDNSLEYLESGWDNIMYRLGDDYVVRLPRRQLGADLIKNEQHYLDHLPASLPIDIPNPIFIGKPQYNYPWQWSVLPYFEGVALDKTTVDSGQVDRFMAFLRSIHRPSLGLAPKNEYRGVHLSVRARDLEDRMENIKDHLGDDFSSLKMIWNDALGARSNEEDLWIHGDLHPRNVLVNEGKLSAIIDWGDITSGDVATDLASIWMLFEDGDTRSKAIQLYDMDDALLARTKGWVIYFATVFFQSGLSDNPRHVSIGKKTFSRLLEEFG